METLVWRIGGALVVHWWCVAGWVKGRGRWVVVFVFGGWRDGHQQRQRLSHEAVPTLPCPLLQPLQNPKRPLHSKSAPAPQLRLALGVRPRRLAQPQQSNKHVLLMRVCIAVGWWVGWLVGWLVGRVWMLALAQRNASRTIHSCLQAKSPPKQHWRHSNPRPHLSRVLVRQERLPPPVGPVVAPHQLYLVGAHLGGVGLGWIGLGWLGLDVGVGVEWC